MVAWSRAVAVGLSVIVAAIGLVVGCAGDAVDDATARDTAVYRSVVFDLVDRSTVVLDDSDQRPVLFVDALASEVPLEVQVEVVSDFDQLFEVRFIDELDEAIEADTPGRSVRSNSLLIGLGPVVGDATASVRGELYLQDGEARAFRYRLTASGDGSWAIVGDPEPIVPEGFAENP